MNTISHAAIIMTICAANALAQLPVDCDLGSPDEINLLNNLGLAGYDTEPIPGSSNGWALANPNNPGTAYPIYIFDGEAYPDERAQFSFAHGIIAFPSVGGFPTGNPGLEVLLSLTGTTDHELWHGNQSDATIDQIDYHCMYEPDPATCALCLDQKLTCLLGDDSIPESDRYTCAEIDGYRVELNTICALIDLLLELLEASPLSTFVYPALIQLETQQADVCEKLSLSLDICEQLEEKLPDCLSPECAFALTLPIPAFPDPGAASGCECPL